MNHARAVFVAIVVNQSVSAQNFDDLTTFRNPTTPYSQLLQVRGGILGSWASEDDETTGLVDEVAWDGSVYYHTDEFGGRTGSVDAYAGRDGLVGSIRDGRVIGDDTSTRLQLSTRLWPFYREGFYRGDSFVPTGRYEGRDWEAYLGFGKPAAEGLFIEFGPFYRRNSFSRSDDTAVNYVVPDDFKAYGGRVHLEQNTVQLDRRTGMARDGFLATVIAEREWNDSTGVFGVQSGFEGELPSSVWRARGRLEWYLPQGSESAWEIFASGALTDERDRIVDYDASRPQGNLWIDAQLRLRLHASDSFTLTPFAHGQFSRILVEDGTNSDKKMFFGCGVETFLHFSETVSFNAWWSYLDNESRPPVSINEDLHGQHMFFAGLVLHFGGRRR